jgi:hypothetical protein
MDLKRGSFAFGLLINLLHINQLCGHEGANKKRRVVLGFGE